MKQRAGLGSLAVSALAAIGLLLVAAWRFGLQREAEVFGLLAAACVAAYYAWEAHKLREVESQAHLFGVLNAAREVVLSTRSRELRGNLYGTFDADLAKVVQEVLGDKYVREGPRLNIHELLGLQANPTQYRELRDRLRCVSYNALETAEDSLAAFDVLAIPVSQGVESAKRAARAYYDLIHDCTPHLVPFIVLARKLRGQMAYRSHFIVLLDELGIEHAPLAREGFAR